MKVNQQIIQNFINSCILESQGRSWSWEEIDSYIVEYFEEPTTEF